MKDIETLLHLLQGLDIAEGGSTAVAGVPVMRMRPDDPSLVTPNRWVIRKDGIRDGSGLDILTASDARDGLPLVNFRAPNTCWLSHDQHIYKILNS